MNRIALFSFLILALALGACRNDAPEASGSAAPIAQDTIAVPDDGGPRDLKQIDSYAAGIDKIKDTLEFRGPRTVDIEGINVETTVYADSTVPVLVYVQAPKGEQWYYLYNRRIIQLRERVAGSKGFEEQIFYYSNSRVIDALSRTAGSPDNLAKAPAMPFRVKDQASDYRFSLGDVNARVFKFLYGGK